MQQDRLELGYRDAPACKNTNTKKYKGELVVNVEKKAVEKDNIEIHWVNHEEGVDRTTEPYLTQYEDDDDDEDYEVLLEKISLHSCDIYRCIISYYKFLSIIFSLYFSYIKCFDRSM